ncbi:MAG: ATP-binding protein [Pseudomonadota bacterium]
MSGARAIVAWLVLALAGTLSLAVAQERTLTVGLYDNEPKSFRDGNGAASGFFPGLIDALAQSNGWRVTYVSCDWTRCLQMVRRGEIDILPDVAYSDDRATRFRFGREPVLQSWSAIYTRRGSSQPVQRLSDLDGRSVAVLSNSGQERALKELASRDGVAPRLVPQPDLPSVMRAVSRGDAEIGVVNHLYGAENEVQFALERSRLIFNPSSLYFVYSPGVPQSVVQAIDSAIALMKADPKSDYYQLLDRWLKPPALFSLPDWAPAAIGLVAALLLASLGVNAYLRKVIAEKTAALREQQNRLKAIFDNAPVEISLKDAQGRYSEVNRQFVRHFALDEADVVGMHPSEVHDADHAQRQSDDDRQVMQTGKTRVRQSEIETDRGTRVEHMVKFPVYDADGRISGVGSVVTDVTEQTRALQRMSEVEQHLTDAVNALPDGFVLFDAEDRMVICNDRFRELYDRSTPAIVKGARFEDILRYGLNRGQFPEAEGREEEWLADRLDRHFRADSAFEQRLREDRWLRVVERRTETGGIVGYRFDISEMKRQARALEGARKRAEAVAGQLREQTRKLAQVVELTGIGGWEFDIETDTLFWDSTTKSIHEVPRWYEPTPDAAMAYFTAESRPSMADAIRACTDRSQPFDLELEMVTASGRRLWVRATGQPVVENGQVRRLSGAIQDITAQKTHEKALEQSWLDAEKANIAKSQFLANMSHEIRTPMNGVTGMLALLLRSELSSTQRMQAQTAHASAAGLMQVLNDILDYSKLEANEMRIDSLPFDLRTVVAEVVAMLELRASEKGLELRSEIAEDLPARLVGDPARVRQILVNLAGNAIKFTETGEVRIHVVTDSAAPGMIRIEVSDTGIGIREDAQPSLFTRFAQADGTIGRRYGGTGLGLAISKQLVEALGGEIGVESTFGEGSRFWFTLPVRGTLALPSAPALGTAAE